MKSLERLAARRFVPVYPEYDPALPIVALDFDGVLAESTWPSPRIGAPIREGILMAQFYAEQGCEVHILTARPDSHFPRIWSWLEGQQIAQCIYDVTGRKMAASLYVDDRAIRWPL